MPEMDRQEFETALQALRSWFPADDHIERKLPGGATWWYVKWQKIKQRFDDVFGSLWSEEYSDPYYLLDPTNDHERSFCVVKCTITIDGRSRQGVGQAPLQILSSKGNDMSRGNPIERAIPEAFKNAAEAWGVGRYLDDQTDDEKKATFFKYLRDRGNSKPLNEHLQEKGIVPTRTRPKSSKPSPGLIDTGAEEREQLKDAIALEMRRVGWTTQDASEHIKLVYGKHTRNQMTIAEMRETVEYLKSQPTPKVTPEDIKELQGRAKLQEVTDDQLSSILSSYGFKSIEDVTKDHIALIAKAIANYNGKAVSVENIKEIIHEH